VLTLACAGPAQVSGAGRQMRLIYVIIIIGIIEINLHTI